MITELLMLEPVHVLIELAPQAARHAEAYVATGQEFVAIQRHCPLEGGSFCRDRCPLRCGTHAHGTEDE